MLYEVEISETYECTKFIEAENEKELKVILYEKTPTLINMNKKELKRIMKDKTSNFQRHDEFNWYKGA